ncbi:hypothetical protein EPN16_04565 [bacterium]|nr:MAG: hypothetical protein EPN16_04565 [bacterium]
MPKKIPVIIIIIALALAILGISKDYLIKSSLALAASKIMGVRVGIDAFSFGIARPVIRVKGFRLYNPKGFPEEPMVDIPKVSVEYDFGALLKKQLYFNRVEFDLSEMTVVKNKDGKLNVDELKVAKKEEKPAEQMALRIDYLSLSIGRVVYKDFTKGEKPSIEIFEANIKNKAFKNISSAEQLASLVLLEALKPTAIKGAKIYALSGLAGVSVFSPVGAALVLAGKDSAEASFGKSYGQVYESSLEIMNKNVKVQLEDRGTGIIKGEADNVNVTVKIAQINEKSVRVTVTARKYILPKPKIASGILYEISQKLK